MRTERARQPGKIEMALGGFAAFFLAIGAIAATVGFARGVDPVGPALIIGVILAVLWIVATAIGDRRR